MKAGAWAKLGVAVWVFACMGVASAQGSRLAEQSLHCSAVLEVLAQTRTDAVEEARHLRRAVEVFTQVHLQELGASGASAQTQLQQRRSQDQAQMYASRAERAAYFREDAVLCGAWAEGFLAQGERYQYLVVFPKVIAPPIRSRYQAWADDALQRWVR